MQGFNELYDKILAEYGLNHKFLYYTDPVDLNHDEMEQVIGKANESINKMEEYKKQYTQTTCLIEHQLDRMYDSQICIGTHSKTIDEIFEKCNEFNVMSKENLKQEINQVITTNNKKMISNFYTGTRLLDVMKIKNNEMLNKFISEAEGCKQYIDKINELLGLTGVRHRMNLEDHIRLLKVKEKYNNIRDWNKTCL